VRLQGHGTRIAAAVTNMAEPISGIVRSLGVSEQKSDPAEWRISSDRRRHVYLTLAQIYLPNPPSGGRVGELC